MLRLATAAPDAWAFARALSRVNAAELMAVIRLISWVVPVPMAIRLPTCRPLAAVTVTVVAPAAAAADKVVSVAAGVMTVAAVDL